MLVLVVYQKGGMIVTFPSSGSSPLLSHSKDHILGQHPKTVCLAGACVVGLRSSLSSTLLASLGSSLHNMEEGRDLEKWSEASWS